MESGLVSICNAQAQSPCSCGAVDNGPSFQNPEDFGSPPKIFSSFVIDKHPQFGQSFFATEDMAAGTIIMEELPLLVAPSWELSPPCITCGLMLTEEELSRRCRICNWPICSEECEKMALHAENECKVFSQKNFTFPPAPEIQRTFWTLILLIRACYLKERDPKSFSQILKLQSECPIGDVEHYSWKNEIELLQPLINTDELNFDSDELQALLEILRLNCHMDTNSRYEDILCASEPRTRSATFLHLKSSRMNHSCVPNCSWSVSRQPEFKIRIVTTVPVGKGEHLTIDYFLEHSLKGTQDRQIWIFNSGFHCQCERCQDPTELGTYMSGIKCTCPEKPNSPSCLLPDDPLNLTESAIWSCKNCGNCREAWEVLPALTTMSGRIVEKQKLFENDPASFISFCKELIKHYSGIALHPNHWLLQEASRAIFRSLRASHKVDSMDLPTSEYYIQIGMYLLSVIEVVNPGLNYNRATLLEGIAYALYEQTYELLANQDYRKAANNLDECVRLLREVYNYYNNNFNFENNAEMTKLNITRAVEFLNDSVLRMLQESHL